LQNKWFFKTILYFIPKFSSLYLKYNMFRMYWKSLYNDEDDDYKSKNIYSNPTWSHSFSPHGASVSAGPEEYSGSFPTFQTFPVGIRRLTPPKPNLNHLNIRHSLTYKYFHPARRRYFYTIRRRPFMRRFIYRPSGRIMFRPIIASRRLDSDINDEDNIQLKYPEEGFDWRYVLGLPPWFLKSSS